MEQGGKDLATIADKAIREFAAKFVCPVWG